MCLIQYNNERSHSLDIYSRPYCRSIQQSVANKLQVVKERLPSQQYYCINARRDSRPHFHANIDTIYWRKLLGHELEYPMRRRKFNRIHRKTIAAKKTGLKERRRNVAVAGGTVPMNGKSKDPGIWDDWNNWSACSVTCGQGRQVRWRHCLSENCSEGLKKAQMRSCRVKDCETKGFLGWLGIKS